MFLAIDLKSRSIEVEKDILGRKFPKISGTRFLGFGVFTKTRLIMNTPETPNPTPQPPQPMPEIVPHPVHPVLPEIDQPEIDQPDIKEFEPQTVPDQHEINAEWNEEIVNGKVEIFEK